jgi:hypothetical protein
LQPDERLFIEAIRDLNRQASRLQAEENQSIFAQNGRIRNHTGSIASSVQGDTAIDVDPNCSSQFVDIAQTMENSGEKLPAFKPTTCSLSPI